MLGPGRALSSARTGTLSSRSTGGTGAVPASLGWHQGCSRVPGLVPALTSLSIGATGAVPAFHRRYRRCHRISGLVPALSPRPGVSIGAAPASQGWYRRCPRVPGLVPALSPRPRVGTGAVPAARGRYRRYWQLPRRARAEQGGASPLSGRGAVRPRPVPHPAGAARGTPGSPRAGLRLP